MQKTRSITGMGWGQKASLKLKTGGDSSADHQEEQIEAQLEARKPPRQGQGPKKPQLRGCGCGGL